MVTLFLPLLLRCSAETVLNIFIASTAKRQVFKQESCKQMVQVMLCFTTTESMGLVRVKLSKKKKQNSMLQLLMTDYKTKVYILESGVTRFSQFEKHCIIYMYVGASKF